MNMENKRIRLALSASIICLASGCAAGPRATLEIRDVNQSQLASSGQRSIDRGKELLQRGQFADAISAFRKAMREEEDSAEANNGLAIAYDRIGRKDLARRYFELAVAEKPDEMRYKTNLARFFESSGQPELALGLLDAPVAVAEVVVTHEAAAGIREDVKVASMAEDISELPESATFEDPITAILADLSAGTVKEVAQFNADSTKDTVVAKLPITEAPAKAKFAVYRPSAEAAIEAMPINLPSAPAPGRAPFDDRIALIADLPRNDRKFAETDGPYIERVSLGEVKLVTLPQSIAAKETIEFDKLAQKLALWADDERRRNAFDNRTGLKGRLAIQNAIERAAVAEAIASLVSTVEQMDGDFAYTTFAGEPEIQGTAAA
jgi:Tetratricopeptide repeat